MPKELPEWRFTAYPKTAIPNRKIEAFVIADLLADIVSGRPSTWGGILTRGTDDGTWNDWGRLGEDMTLSNVGFARFAPDGSVLFSPAGNSTTMPNAQKGAGGFFVRPTVRPLVIASPLGPITGTPSPNTNQIGWIPKSGQFYHANTPGTLRPSGLLNMSAMNAPDVAVSASPWPKGAGIHANILTIGSNSPNKRGEILLKLSPTLQLALRQNAPPVVERLTLKKNGNYSVPQWNVWSAFEDVGECKLRGENYEVSVFHMAGRLVCQIGDKAKWLIDGNDSQEAPPGTAPPSVVRSADMSALIGGVPLEFTANNLRARLDVGRRESTDEDGNVATGTVTRTITRRQATGEVLEPIGMGNLPSGTTMPSSLSVDGKKVTYTVELTPGEGGLSSPFLSQVYLSYSPVWTEPVGSPIDITPLVSAANITHAHPPVQTGLSGSITVDMALLKDKLPSAANVIKDFCPVEIEGRWDGGAWWNIAQGYFMGVSAEQNAYNDGNTTLNIQGAIARLRDPAGIVDGLCSPLDYYHARRIKDLQLANNSAAEDNFVIIRDGDGNAIGADPLPSSTLHYFSSDGVQDIVEHYLGPGTSATFNGNGNSRRYLPQGHPPILNKQDMYGSWLAVASAYGESLTAGSIKSQSGAMYMPPFETDALGWINKLAADDFLIFTEGLTVRNSATARMCLMYGAREELLRNSLLHQISGIDTTKLLAQMLSYETKPEKDINRVLVLATPPGVNEIPFAPAVLQGEARLHPSHPRSPEKTWPRTLTVRSNLVRTAAQAQALALVILTEVSGDQAVWPKHRFLGEAKCITGDVFAASDTGGMLGYEDIWFRSESIEHEYKSSPAEGGTWFTTASMRMMTLTEISAFTRIQNGL